MEQVILVDGRDEYKLTYMSKAKLELKWYIPVYLDLRMGYWRKYALFKPYKSNYTSAYQLPAPYGKMWYESTIYNQREYLNIRSSTM